MKFDSSFNSKKIHPVRNIVCFRWIKPGLFSKFAIPDDYFAVRGNFGKMDGIRFGHFYVGKVLSLGHDIKYLKINDFILVHEYSVINYNGEWKENEIYFIKENSIRLILKDIPKDFNFSIRRIVNEKAISRMADRFEKNDKAGSMLGSVQDARKGRKRAVEKIGF